MTNRLAYLENLLAEQEKTHEKIVEVMTKNPDSEMVKNDFFQSHGIMYGYRHAIQIMKTA